MDQSTDSPPSTRYRRPRVEGPRSKLGCATCISKKVKCDECRPVCGRCKRLNLACIWSPPKEKVKLKGLTTSASRMGERGASLPAIVPKPPQETQYVTSMPDHGVANLAPRNYPKSQYLVGGNTPGSDTNDQERAVPLCTDQSTLAAYSQSQDESHRGTCDTSTRPFLDEAFNYYLDVWDPLILASSEIVEPDPGMVGDQDNIDSMNLPTVDADDSEAVLFFRTTFSSLKSTRNSIWSAHAVFFLQALQKQFALHFLLAVSHNEFALNCSTASNKPALPDKASEHYKKGSQLLLEHMTSEVKPDTVAALISFLYMYMFWMRRETVHSQRLRQISEGVLTYVKTHEITEACVKSACATLSSNLAQWSQSEEFSEDPALVARLLIYIYDRDVYCSFFGCGGQFANHLDADLETRHIIWSTSKTFLLRYWGHNYPMDEFTQDNEHARTHDMYFDLITICQQINRHSQSHENNPGLYDEEVERNLRRRLDAHQVEHSLLFHLVAIDDSPQPKIPLLAYVSVAFFYALQIYLLRASSQAFGTAPCPKVDSALKALISTAHLAIKAGPVKLLERFQWALLIAGIETKDVIHQEWITFNIPDLGVRNILCAILKRKRALGGTITISAIRKLLEGDGDLATRGLPSKIGLLD